MKITVLGLSPLGCVVAASCSRYFEVAALDPDPARIDDLRAGRISCGEPGLADLLATNRSSRRLEFTTNTILACVGADVLWLTEDAAGSTASPAGEHLRSALPNLSPGTLVLVSSRMPVGTCAALGREFPQFHFASVPIPHSPGRALESFEKAARVLVGVRSTAKEALLETLFAPFTPQVDFVAAETAEAVVSTDFADGMPNDPRP